MKEAYLELHGSNNIINEACILGCKVMEYLANFFDCTYGEINLFILYIFQPIIYIGLSSIGNYRLCKLSKIGYIFLGINLLYLIDIINTYSKVSLDSLCEPKIQSIYYTAHSVGLTYAEFNIFVFIISFILILLISFIMKYLFKYKYIYILLSVILNGLMPYFVYVFYT